MSRTLRRDAAANRERLLTAAAEVFHDGGTTAGLEEIARRAGVGPGTLYRHFPCREALFEGLLDDLLDTYLTEVRAALALPDGSGFEPFLRAMAEVQATPRGVGFRLWTSAAAQARKDELTALVAELLRSAQDAGGVRRDATVDDVTGVFVALRGIRELPVSNGAALDWRRHLELCLRGLRP